MCVYACRTKDSQGEDVIANQMSGYRLGIPLKFGVHIESENKVLSVPEPFSLLIFPQRSLNGHCSWIVPVKFLTSSNDVCSVRISPTSCSGNPQLDARMFSPGSALWPGGPSKRIIAELGSRTPVSHVDVKFSCSTTVGLEKHVKQCEWDDGGVALPPSPIKDGRMCRNVVVSAVYNFMWSGQIIVSLGGMVILADIEIDGDERGDYITVSQTFRVSFTPAKSITRTQTSRRDAGTDVSVRGLVDRTNLDQRHVPFTNIGS